MCHFFIFTIQNIYGAQQHIFLLITHSSQCKTAPCCEDLSRLTKTSIELTNQLGLPGINFLNTNPFVVKDTGSAGRLTNGWKSDRLNQLTLVGTDSRIGQPIQTRERLTNGGLDKKIGGLVQTKSADSTQSKK